MSPRTDPPPRFSIRLIKDIILNIILAPFTLIYSIVTFSSYKKGAEKNSLLLGIDEATYSKLLDMCQERGAPPGVVKNIVETKYDLINLTVDKKVPAVAKHIAGVETAELLENIERANKICDIYKENLKKN